MMLWFCITSKWLIDKIFHYVLFQESCLCVLKKTHVWCSWACWDEKKSKYPKFEGNGFAFEVPLLEFYLFPFGILHSVLFRDLTSGILYFLSKTFQNVNLELFGEKAFPSSEKELVSGQGQGDYNDTIIMILLLVWMLRNAYHAFMLLFSFFSFCVCQRVLLNNILDHSARRFMGTPDVWCF